MELKVKIDRDVRILISYSVPDPVPDLENSLGPVPDPGTDPGLNTI